MCQLGRRAGEIIRGAALSRLTVSEVVGREVANRVERKATPLILDKTVNEKVSETA